MFPSIKEGIRDALPVLFFVREWVDHLGRLALRIVDNFGGLPLVGLRYGRGWSGNGHMQGWRHGAPAGVDGQVRAFGFVAIPGDGLSVYTTKEWAWLGYRHFIFAKVQSSGKVGVKLGKRRRVMEGGIVGRLVSVSGPNTRRFLEHS